MIGTADFINYYARVDPICPKYMVNIILNDLLTQCRLFFHLYITVVY